MGCVDSQSITTSPIHKKSSSEPNTVQDKYISDQVRGQREGEINDLRQELKQMKYLMTQQTNEITSLKTQLAEPKKEEKEIMEEYNKLQNIGDKIIRKYTLLCRECLPKTEKFVVKRKEIAICSRCEGHGVVIAPKKLEAKCQMCKYERFFPVLNLCQECSGKGANLL